MDGSAGTWGGWTLMKWGWTLRELPFTTVDNLFGQNSQQQPGEGEGPDQVPEDFISAFCR